MKYLLLAVILSISTFPPIAIAAPLFKLWTDIGLYNEKYGLGLIPPCAHVLAAVNDLHPHVVLPRHPEGPRGGGARGRGDALPGVPQDRPAAGRARAWSPPGLLVFFFAWNEFLFAITLTSTDEARTVPAAIAFFTGSVKFEEPIGTISAASVVVMIPLVVLVLIFQKRIVAGLTAGAVKG